MPPVHSNAELTGSAGVPGAMSHSVHHESSRSSTIGPHLDRLSSGAATNDGIDMTSSAESEVEVKVNVKVELPANFPTWVTEG
jgi:hypothetical protein